MICAEYLTGAFCLWITHDSRRLLPRKEVILLAETEASEAATSEPWADVNTLEPPKRTHRADVYMKKLGWYQ